MDESKEVVSEFGLRLEINKEIESFQSRLASAPIIILQVAHGIVVFSGLFLQVVIDAFGQQLDKNEKKHNCSHDTDGSTCLLANECGVSIKKVGETSMTILRTFAKTAAQLLIKKGS